MAFTGHRKLCPLLIQTLIGVVLTTTKPRSSSVVEVFPTYPLLELREEIVRKTSLHLLGSLPSMGTRQSIQAHDAISTSRTYSPKEPIYLFSTNVEKLQAA